MQSLTPITWELDLAAVTRNAPPNTRPVRVWTQDESRLGLMTILRRRLTLRGIKPLAPYQHAFDSFYLYGTIEPATGESFWLQLPALDTVLCQLFVNHFAATYPDSLNLLVSDNHGCHTTPRLCLPAHVRLIFTPPYTPEVNPIERFWEDLKDRLALELFDSLDGLSDSLCDVIQAYTPAQLASLTSYPFFKNAVDAVSSL